MEQNIGKVAHISALDVFKMAFSKVFSSWKCILMNLFITCMCSLVYLQVFWSCKESVTAREGTHERFLSCMNSHMVDQLVLGLESFAFSWTLLPMASMVRVLRSSDVVHGQVVDDVRHGVEHLVADLPGLGVLPHADDVHLDRRLVHVSVVGGHVVASIQTVAVVVAGGCYKRVSCCSRGHKRVNCCPPEVSVEAGTEHGYVVWVVGCSSPMGSSTVAIGRLWINRRKRLHFKRICHHHLVELWQCITQIFFCFLAEIFCYVLSLWGSGQNWSTLTTILCFWSLTTPSRAPTVGILRHHAGWGICQYFNFAY